ncbi:hypothetical protein A1O1_02736 [Capronia coronata CBS 617.96]|uniref:Major facilitator superfamily (MFS) profile domain-containing protein n=1 Tax=Capronia coronata CBS 617.96 TaxID=1182541 RepID=W9YN76_9EURO|nr:uncharacterized protein A1O1_02736 [Capronia coronata CBS 617.96]EXJ94342.1 hypothetical protein A1O1_02736 [Capronia coronata CBS 617.96]
MAHSVEPGPAGPVPFQRATNTNKETISMVENVGGSGCSGEDKDKEAGPGVGVGVTFGGDDAEPIDKAVERRLKRKLDFVILPALSIVYFLSAMARSDLGNAKVAGLEQSIPLTARQYSNISSSFLAGYVVFQLPGTVLIKKIGPPFQFAGAMLLWGAVTTALVACTSYSDLMGLRFLVGAAEAYVQGSTLYLSFWYTYPELVTRGAIIYSTSALAGAFNGLIAYGIQENLAHKAPWKPWQWLFIIEGIIPMVYSLIVLAVLPATPDRGQWLFTREEIEVARKRSRATHNHADQRLRVNLLWKPLIDPKFWLNAVMYSCAHFASGSLPNFLPAIIRGFGYTSIKAQLMSVVVYACSFVSILFWAFLGERYNRRGYPIAACSLVGAIGFLLLITLTENKVRMFAACLMVAGVFPAIPLILSWTTANIAGYTKRSAAIAMVNIVAQCTGIGGNQAYSDPPIYRKGNASAMALCFLLGVCALAQIWYAKYLNKKKAALKASLSPEELQRLRDGQVFDIVGDEHIDFVYLL